MRCTGSTRTTSDFCPSGRSLGRYEGCCVRMPSGSSDSPLVKFLHLFGHSSSRERANSGRIPSAPYHPPTRGLRAGDGEGADRVFGVRFASIRSLRRGD